MPVDVATHHAALFDAFAKDADARNWTYLPYGPFGSTADLRDWMERTCTGDDPLFHTILDGEGVPSGLASFLRIDPGNGVIEIGHIHLSPRLQGTAASTEMQALMMGRVFDELGYRRYEWKCDALNAPSRRAAERLGFTYEGTFRQATVYKGRNRDTAWFSILDTEWPERKARFTRWLDRSNFDANGRQKTPLQGG
ncbi:N-acetyltransferase [Wenxinia marina]|nr:N-acetyltransferase [Wenxinia marina]